MTVDIKAWIKRHGWEKSAELLGVSVRMAKAVGTGLHGPSRLMENLAMALDRIEELESQLKAKNLPSSRPPKIKQ
ncbi:MAG: hypothetical protein ACR2Q4_23995 [Geminicoccaceae bacterium]